jgi:hypothetical protein
MKQAATANTPADPPSFLRLPDFDFRHHGLPTLEGFDRPEKKRCQGRAFALHTMYHNFAKISGAFRMTPATAAGVTSGFGKLVIVRLAEGWEAAQSEEW